MKIFFTASYYGKAKFQKYYDLVLQTLELHKLDIISPEKNNYLDLISKSELKKYKDHKDLHYEAIKRGILWSDATVIEISNEDFQLGHEATLAILNKKHVLCLSTTEDFSKKIKNRYFHAGKYNQYNIEELIENFIQLVKNERLEKRFNLFLSDSEFNYLEEASKDNGVNKSEYIRMLIDKDRL